MHLWKEKGYETLRKKWIFPHGLRHIYWRNAEWKTLFFVQWNLIVNCNLSIYSKILQCFRQRHSIKRQLKVFETSMYFLQNGLKWTGRCFTHYVLDYSFWASFNFSKVQRTRDLAWFHFSVPGQNYCFNPLVPGVY